VKFRRADIHDMAGDRERETVDDTLPAAVEPLHPLHYGLLCLGVFRRHEQSIEAGRRGTGP
jgi:hypothetical protein